MIPNLGSNNYFRIIIRGIGIAFVIQIFGTAIGYLAQIILAQWIGVEEYGRFTFIVAWTQAFAFLALMGFDIGVLRLIPEYLFRKEVGYLHGLLRWSRVLALSVGIVLALISTAVLMVFRGRQPGWSVFLWGSPLVPLVAVTEIQTQILRSKSRIAQAYGPPLLLQPLLFLTITTVLLFFSKSLTGESAVLSFSASFLLILVLQAWFIKREFYYSMPKVPIRFSIPQWMRVTLPLLMISFFAIALLKVDTIMVGFLLDIDEVGIYTAAYRTATIVGFSLMATNAIVAPLIGMSYAKKDLLGMQEIVRMATLGGFSLAILLGSGILGLSQVLLRGFGEEFLRGQSVLLILIIGQIFNVGAGPVGLLLMITGHEREPLRVFGWSAAINFLLCLILIPVGGIIGAAFASATCTMIWNIWLCFRVTALIKIQPSIFSALRWYALRK